jgi:hypothetical protein
MKEEPLGDFELICESKARRAFLPSSEGCRAWETASSVPAARVMGFCTCGASGRGVAFSWAHEPAANAMHDANRKQRSRVIEILVRGKYGQQTINDIWLAVAGGAIKFMNHKGHEVARRYEFR